MPASSSITLLEAGDVTIPSIIRGRNYLVAISTLERAPPYRASACDSRRSMQTST